MKFLNKKEQVLDIELTEYGKRLLSKGLFKPTYYAFFDDGVLYDSQYGGFTEAQNDAAPRIIQETPQLETQVVYNGVESHIQRQNEIIRSVPKKGNLAPNPGVLELLDQAENYQNSTDRLFSLTYQLGTSQLTNNYIPAWDISFIKGLISGSVSALNALTCSNQLLNIPQIPVAPITYETRVDTLTELEAEDVLASELYGNETISVTQQDSAILLQIKEVNVDFDHDNFDIEVFEVKSVTDTNIITCQPICSATGSLATCGKIDELIPLYFIKEKSNIENNILLDINEREQILENPELELDPSYVEYFFDIAVDNEIDKSIICPFVRNETEGIFAQKVLDCEPSTFKRRLDPKKLFNTDADDGDCSS